MIGSLKTVVLDAREIRPLSGFYAALAGWSEAYAEDDWITMTTPDGWRVGLQLAPDHVSPRWPDSAHPQQAHLDLRVFDLDAATAQAVELGATLLAKNESWNTLADPAGHPFDLCHAAEDPGHPSLAGLMLDCPDAKALSTFYAKLLGKPITYEGEGMAMIGNEGEQPIMFQQVADYHAPGWPDPARPQQVHLDIQVDDIEAGEAAALAIGAVRLPGQGDNWRVYADPAGKPFCLVWAND